MSCILTYAMVTEYVYFANINAKTTYAIPHIMVFVGNESHLL